VVVGALGQVLCLDDLLQFVIEEWHRRGRSHECLGSEDAEHAGLSADATLVIHHPDTYVVELDAAVHGGDAVRFGDDEELARLESGPHVVCDLGERNGLGISRPRLGSKNAETRLRHDPKTGHTVEIQDLVLAISEEYEIQIEQPLQELFGVFDVFGWIARCRLAGQIDHSQHAALEKAEVVDGAAHVTQGVDEIIVEALPLIYMQRPIQLVVLHRLADFGVSSRTDRGERSIGVAGRPYHGVDHMIDCRSVALDCAGDGIDEKRSIQGRDLHDRSVAPISVVLGRGIEHAHRDRVETTVAGELPDSGHMGGDFLRAEFGESTFVDSAQVETRKVLDDGSRGSRDEIGNLGNSCSELHSGITVRSVSSSHEKSA
jgi:hypothetical protein